MGLTKISGVLAIISGLSEGHDANDGGTLALATYIIVSGGIL